LLAGRADVLVFGSFVTIVVIFFVLFPTKFIYSEYSANAVHFDGTSDYLARGADLTGTVDGKQGTISFWIRKTGSDGGLSEQIFSNAKTLGGNNDFTFLVTKTGDDEIAIRGDNSGGLTRLLIESSVDSIEVADGWVHVLASWDLSDSAKRHLYINDVSDINVGIYTDDTIDYSVADWGVGARPGGNSKLDGDLADFWFDDTYIDFSVEANRRDFITAQGRVVDLGADGSNPTSLSPLVFLSGDTSTWHTNDGTGGGFTENGALTDAENGPPPSFPIVTTDAANNITDTGATLNGTITDTGGDNANERGFAWGTNSSLSGGDTATTTSFGDFGTGTFSVATSSLTKDTTYYFRAWCKHWL